MAVEYTYCKKCGTKMTYVRIDSPNINITHHTCPHCKQRHKVTYGQDRLKVEKE